MAIKWDYRIIGITGPETQSGVAEMLARHGADGWELVAIDFARGWAYLKRAIDCPSCYIGKPCDNLDAEAVKDWINSLD